MKKLLAITVIIAAMAMVSISAYAAESDSLTLRVRITPSISVNITETELQMGDVAAAATAASTTGITVTNNGSGVNETYSISLTNSSAWTADQTAAGVDKFVLNAAFDSDGTGITWDNANHALSTAPVACSATKFAGDQTGAGVPYNAARKLWFQFKAPTATTATDEQGIVITITAQAS